MLVFVSLNPTALGSNLVVQSPRYHYSKSLDEIYKMNMLLRNDDFGVIVTFWGVLTHLVTFLRAVTIEDSN